MQNSEIGANFAANPDAHRDDERDTRVDTGTLGDYISSIINIKIINN